MTAPIQATVALAAFFLCGTVAFGDVVLFVSEPYGGFGHMNPTGHAAVYLPRVCAATPTSLRRCEPGELGVVISRYHRIAGYDWIAIPVIPYLYAVEDLTQVPAFADPATVLRLRDAYRRTHLIDLVPDETVRKKNSRGWVQLVGAAFDRRIYAFQFLSTVEQDDELIRILNSGKNRRRFNILYRNCADFARTTVNLYLPKALRRSILADAAIMTPKQAAKSLVSYGRKHPEINLTRWIIPQIPGSKPRSKPVRGVFESLVRSKKYAVPLTVFQPFATGGVAAGYVFRGRFDPKRDAEPLSSPLAVRSAFFPSLASADTQDQTNESPNN
ncbi:MAG: hypothetical protein EHM61_17000 [Acidobacteria bacterium]|nr:MAG: hypothetical protein EHM61_17000 [Acidobacteriota bacterium]